MHLKKNKNLYILNTILLIQIGFSHLILASSKEDVKNRISPEIEIGWAMARTSMMLVKILPTNSREEIEIISRGNFNQIISVINNLSSTVKAVTLHKIWENLSKKGTDVYLSDLNYLTQKHYEIIASKIRHLELAIKEGNDLTLTLLNQNVDESLEIITGKIQYEILPGKSSSSFNKIMSLFKNNPYLSNHFDSTQKKMNEVLKKYQSSVQISVPGQDGLTLAAQSLLLIVQEEMALTKAEQLGFQSGKQGLSAPMRIALAVIDSLIYDKILHPELEMLSSPSIFTDYDSFVVIARLFSLLPIKTELNEYQILAEQLVRFSLLSRAFADTIGGFNRTYQELDSKFSSLSGERVDAKNIKFTLENVMLRMEDYRHTLLKNTDAQTIEKNNELVTLAFENEEFDKLQKNFINFIEKERENYSEQKETKLKFMTDLERQQEHHETSENYLYVRDALREVMHKASSPAVGAIVNLFMIMPAYQYSIITQFDLKNLFSDILMNGEPSEPLILTIKDMISSEMLEVSSVNGLEKVEGLNVSIINNGIGEWILSSLAKDGEFPAISERTVHFHFPKPSVEKINVANVLARNSQINNRNTIQCSLVLGGQ
jgi:hypothetical protein